MKSGIPGRLGIFAGACGIVGVIETWWFSVKQPAIATRLALAQINGSTLDAARLRGFIEFSYGLHVAAMVVILAAGLVCFGPWTQMLFAKLKTRNAARSVALLAVASLVLTGCKPYDAPEYIEIDTSETGFLIPLEGDAGEQARFQSEEYLKQRKVAAKRVQISHRWAQEGRMETSGKWIPTVRLIKVNRSPITREWTTEQVSNGGAIARTDHAIWIESADSVGFSMGFACTAFIAESEAARFLYWYPSGSLADVMDREIRARIQQVAAEVAAKYPLDLLRGKKQEIADAVTHDVTNFFQTRGVTVTTIGMFGGMTYENPEIQRSIDQTFIAQQLKVVAEARFQAQQRENDRIELEATGTANAKKSAAAGEAEAIRDVNQALNEAKQNPMLYQLKALEVEKARVEKWDGKYPTWYLGGGVVPSLLLNVPSPETVAASR